MTNEEASADGKEEEDASRNGGATAKVEMTRSLGRRIRSGGGARTTTHLLLARDGEQQGAAAAPGHS